MFRFYTEGKGRGNKHVKELPSVKVNKVKTLSDHTTLSYVFCSFFLMFLYTILSSAQELIAFNWWDNSPCQKL